MKELNVKQMRSDRMRREVKEDKEVEPRHSQKTKQRENNKKATRISRKGTKKKKENYGKNSAE